MSGADETEEVDCIVGLGSWGLDCGCDVWVEVSACVVNGSEEVCVKLVEGEEGVAQ